MSDDAVSLTVGKAEAIVLLDLLASFYGQPVLEIRDNAERLALVRLHGSLEKSLVEVFSPEYKSLLSQGRADLLRQWGTLD